VLISRGIARFIDFLLFSVPSSLLVDSLRPAGESSHYVSPGIALVVLATLILPAVYEVVMIRRFGWTVGKVLLGVRVIGADGQVPTWRGSLLRWLVVEAISSALGNWGTGLTSALAAAWFGVIVVSLLLNPERRGLHDIVARTRAVELSPAKPRA
jgi:uncharacterized RDD family membrane protein YckC